MKKANKMAKMVMRTGRGRGCGRASSLWHEHTKKIIMLNVVEHEEKFKLSVLTFNDKKHSFETVYETNRSTKKPFHRFVDYFARSTRAAPS